MTLSPYGIREWLTASVLAGIVLVVSGLLGWWWIGMLVLVPWFVVAWFFRDPLGRRPDSPDPGDLVSPADGRISAIERVREHPAVDGPAVIIRIFLSVLDVHVNRSPCRATVRGLVYTPGKYLDARTEESAKVNESNLILLSMESGEPFGVRQVSGAIARRIVCPISSGDTLDRAQRFGMIKFGSTTELILPDRGAEGPEVRVAVGDRVRGGVTILASVEVAGNE